jgi:hypothetical protein
MCNRSQLIGAEQAGAQSWTTSSECPGGTFPAKRLHAYWSGGSNDTCGTGTVQNVRILAATGIVQNVRILVPTRIVPTEHLTLTAYGMRTFHTITYVYHVSRPIPSLTMRGRGVRNYCWYRYSLIFRNVPPLEIRWCPLSCQV